MAESDSTARRWMECWKAAAPVLEAKRRQELRAIDTRHAILALDDAFRAALRRGVRRTWSGLVEQQRIFARAEVERSLPDPMVVSAWSRDLFRAVADRLAVRC